MAPNDKLKLQYSKFDENGTPTHDVTGMQITKNAKKFQKGIPREEEGRGERRGGREGRRERGEARREEGAQGGEAREENERGKEVRGEEED